jgi:endo-1,4-beta-xylanase
MTSTSRSHIEAVACAIVASLVLASCLRPPAQGSPLAGKVEPAPPPPVATAPKPIAVPGLPPSVAWDSSGPLIVPVSDAKHDLVAVKDPTVVLLGNRWHVYASSVARGGIYGMVYLSFADWADAPKASFYYMDQTPGFNTYVAAPQLFYFTPKKLWFLVFQSGPPMFSTAEDPSDPTKWALPQPFYPKTPPGIDESGGWLDFWVICDAQFCHLFFSNDHGRFYKSKTPIDRFPRGFDQPVVVMEDPEAGRLFEACNVYKLAGSGKYLALVEAFDKTSGFKRYFRSWTAESLEGPWTVLHDDATAPFAGKQNVTKPWSDDISHGELIRAGHDETMVIDGMKLRYLYQAFTPGANTSDYNAIPWQLGLLTLK